MYSIQHQFIIKKSAQQVFDALTSPAGLNAWWTLDAQGKPELGEAYRWYFGPEYDWQAQVCHVVQGKELTWRMVVAMDDWMPTQVGFSLSENGGATTVSFFHKNWDAANDHYAITNFCWGQLLKGLKDYLENGVIVPFELRN